MVNSDFDLFPWMHLRELLMSVGCSFFFFFSLLQTSSGGVHIHETRQKFLDGSLHPANILMCPHTCVTNLPQPRQKHPGK